VLCILVSNAQNLIWRDFAFLLIVFFNICYCFVYCIQTLTICGWASKVYVLHVWLVRSSLERAVRVRALAGDTVLCSWARHLTLTVPLSTQEYKWVPVNCWGDLTNCRGVTCDRLASRPGGVEILLATSCYRNRGKLRQLQYEQSAPRLHLCIYVLNVWLICVVFNVFVAERILIPMLILQAYQHLIETYKEVLFTRYGLF